MVRFERGDVLQAEADALVNTVNCVGVMGRGVAAQFKKAFPANFKAYAAACKRGELQPGRMFVFEVEQLSQPQYIINFPTKRHWRGKSRLEDIRAGLAALVAEIRTRGIRSVALPPLGSGLGGLEWNEVRPLIADALSPLDKVDIVVFEPGGGPADPRANRSKDVPKMTPGRAALVGLMDRYLAGLMDVSISLLEIHKLMYFLQEAGEPLKLQYVKAAYGPYAENLRHVLRAIEGHLVAGYADGGDAPAKQIALVPGAVKDATNFLERHEETRDRFARVVRLVEGFETPFGLELLATAHWVATREAVGIGDATLFQERFYAWEPRKRCFSPAQIGIAVDRLASEGWIGNA